ncbi:nucleotidyltransferase family protein [Dyadobacter sandarakinus]|uniref:Nucleotidyltransferase family protein n=1 Tax=Dyadobacter sandarakinus TaxID=2747268 RepID=A0ABX7IB53_9BACT|nr:nucleotidyltransferase family protein [Dyadobacter sandarakinus]QRR02953.1 nucleotidyltransferase family protein [Dyadobacter sandarakinus]
MTVQNKDEVLQLIEKHKPAIKRLGAQRLGLFGSFVREEQKDESDVDLVVEFSEGKKTFRNFMNLADYLEALFNRKVELVTWQSLALFIQRNVKEEIEYVSITD